MTKPQKFGIIGTLLVGIFAWFWFLFDAIDVARAEKAKASVVHAASSQKIEAGKTNK
jgi:hypothetical protein